MDWLRQILFRARSLWRRRDFETEMAEEMRFHLAMNEESNRRDGMSDQEAHFAAQRSFGGVEQAKENARDQATWRWLEQLVQDFRYAARQFARNRRYALMAAGIVALGVGVNTALFSTIQGILLNPFPYAKANEIWTPRLVPLKAGGSVGSIRMSDFLALRESSAVAQAIATNPEMATLAGGINPEVVRTVRVTAATFDFLGVPPLIGRSISAADLRADGGAEPVVVLSFQLWHRHFNGDPGVIGQTIVVNDTPRVVIGVMPPRFNWFTSDGLWEPLPTTDLQRGTVVFLRLNSGLSKENAEQQLFAAFRSIQETAPNRFPKEGFAVRLNNFVEESATGGRVRSSLQLLGLAVAFLLLIACTNVANLQMARGAARSHEFAIRLALGASRGRLVRQLLTESVILSSLGGIGGAALSLWLTKLIVFLLPATYVPSEVRIGLNGTVLAFCAGLSVLTGIAFGLLPALHSTRRDAGDALKRGGTGAGGGSHRLRASGWLVISQVGLSVLLVAGATLAVRSFVQSSVFDPGFEAEHTLMLRVPLTPKRYVKTTERNAFTRDLLNRVRALPGITAAAAGTLPGMEGTATYLIPGQTLPDGARITANAMSAEYVAALGLRLRAGRNLTEQEIANGEPVALINESAARLWEGVNPLGRALLMEIPPSPGAARPAPLIDGKRAVTVVGIVGDIRRNGLERETLPGVFLPYTLRGGNNRLLIVRAEGDPGALLHAIRTELHALDSEQPLDQPVTWEDLLARETSAPRFNLAIFGALAVIALVLAAGGIYSVLSYNVAQRSREIGVRIALGAERAQIVALVLSSGARLIGSGVLLGIAISVPLVVFARRTVFGLAEFDPLAILAAAALLGAVGWIACIVPARRAAKVDPMEALRTE
jgi:putative ABC transport system permease protein